MATDGTSLDSAPDVSVVMPVHNGGELLRVQLESLCQQDFAGSWEVVVADNNSDDGSAELVMSFADRLPVRVADASGGVGAAYARNVAARAARGAWLAYCDADDICDPAWLRQLFEARDRGDLIAGALDAKRLNRPETLQARGFHRDSEDLPDGPLGFLPYSPSANLMISKAHLEQIGGWDEGLSACEDIELCWRAQLAGLTLVKEPDAVVYYRFRGSTADFYRQVRRDAGGEPELYLRYRDRGATRPPWWHLPQQIWWLTTRAPYLVLGTRRRLVWVAVAAHLVGRVKGSRRHHVVYI